MSARAIFYDAPAAKEFVLPTRPELASWDRAGTPSQQRLAAYLAMAERAVAPVVRQVQGLLALRLDVGLPPSVDLLAEHDLDNYLFPLMKALDTERRVVSVWGFKAYGDESYIGVAPARAVDGQRERAISFDVVTTASSETGAFKEQVCRRLDGLTELPDGPVWLEIGFTVGEGRYWPNLWKATIDSLDRILGRTEPYQEWHPRDGRITTLGLHRTVDPTRGHDVQIALRASPCDS